LTCLANNVSVSNVSRGSITDDGLNSYSMVSFDVAWDNSWRVSIGPSNWDAVWLFVKFSKDGGTTWEHASLHNSGHLAPAGMTITTGLLDPGSSFEVISNPGIGVFLFRSTDGTGSVSANGVSLRWDFRLDGVLTSSSVLLQVYALEMVFVPQGSFFLGDSSSRTGGSNSHFFDASDASGAAVTIGASAPFISDVFDGSGVSGDISWVAESGGAGSLPGSREQLAASFPTGYSAFYVMKYEVTQGDWVAFFNALDPTQKGNRDVTSNVNGGKNSDNLIFRNSVSWDHTNPSSAAVLPDRGGGATYADVAMTYLSWADLVAYLAWSGLRPMSELEFEKAARGSGQPAVPFEYAWGNASNVQVTGLTNDGTSTEVPSGGITANLNRDSGISGPIRVGSLASGSTSRIDSGASYYGIMELSGNAGERTVTMGQVAGRAFTGTHGDGTLSTVGDADVSSWPGTNAEGSGFRGSSWPYNAAGTRVSEREDAAVVRADRSFNRGGRGVLSAPSSEG
jgi:formylglycine-generating enzyme required for sulfatase activity